MGGQEARGRDPSYRIGAARDYDRLEAGLIELGRNRDFKDARKGSGKNYRTGVLRDDVWQARESLQNTLTDFEADANADLAAALRERIYAAA